MERLDPFNSYNPYFGKAKDSYGQPCPDTISDQQSKELLKFIIVYLFQKGGIAMLQNKFNDYEKMTEELYKKLTSLCETEAELMYCEKVLQAVVLTLSYGEKRIRQSFSHNIPSIGIYEIIFDHTINIIGINDENRDEMIFKLGLEVKNQPELWKKHRGDQKPINIRKKANMKIQSLRDERAKILKKLSQTGMPPELKRIFGIEDDTESEYDDFMKAML